MPAGSQVFKQWVSVIDERTTIICLDAAGQIQRENVPFETMNGYFDSPPAHVHCRALVSPWMQGFVSEQRALANAELKKRPLWQRKKGPGGTGAPRVPLPSTPPTPVAVRAAVKSVAKSAARSAKTTVKAASKAAAKAKPVVKKATPKAKPAPKNVDDDLIKTADSSYARGVNPNTRYQGAFEEYTGEGHEYMNEYLREGTLELAAKSARDDIANLTRAILYAPRTTKPMTVWRGAMWPEDLLDETFIPGYSFTEAGFLSTTTSRKIAEGFGDNILFKIDVPKGTKAIVGEMTERELLIQRGSTLRILRVERIPKESGSKARRFDTWIIHARLEQG